MSDTSYSTWATYAALGADVYDEGKRNQQFDCSPTRCARISGACAGPATLGLLQGRRGLTLGPRPLARRDWNSPAPPFTSA